MTDIGAEITSRVKALNETWRSERFHDLEPFFHPEVVLVHPRFEGRTVGRDALIASYADFASKARILEFELGEVHVDVIGDSAIAVTPWRMLYEYEAARYDEAGWDVLVFNRHAGAWVVVWRTVVLGSTANDAVSAG